MKKIIPAILLKDAPLVDLMDDWSRTCTYDWAAFNPFGSWGAWHAYVSATEWTLMLSPHPTLRRVTKDTLSYPDDVCNS